MNNSIQKTGPSPFDSFRRVDENGNEFWSARELQPLLGYARWQKFKAAIERAIAACHNSGGNPENHITRSGNMVEIGSGAKREATDYCLSRYGADLVAMNGDPHKPQIAAAQSYFAVKTREAETRQPLTQIQALQVVVNQMAEQERLMLEQSQRLDRTEQQVQRTEQQVNAIVDLQQAAAKALAEVPRSDTPAPQVTTRAKINRLVRDFAQREGLDYRQVWRRLYTEAYYRLHVNFRQRAKKRGGTALDAVEAAGMLDELYAIASEVLK
ncbi:MAG: hypothetical protein J7642_21435 [Cyanobacteria bacterium SBC]|nr:hypothetical protein [Cyanobacteria bacterium SBC]